MSNIILGLLIIAAVILWFLTPFGLNPLGCTYTWNDKKIVARLFLIIPILIIQIDQIERLEIVPSWRKFIPGSDEDIALGFVEDLLSRRFLSNYFLGAPVRIMMKKEWPRFIYITPQNPEEFVKSIQALIRN